MTPSERSWLVMTLTCSVHSKKLNELCEACSRTCALYYRVYLLYHFLICLLDAEFVHIMSLVGSSQKSIELGHALTCIPRVTTDLLKQESLPLLRLLQLVIRLASCQTPTRRPASMELTLESLVFERCSGSSHGAQPL